MQVSQQTKEIILNLQFYELAGRVTNLEKDLVKPNSPIIQERVESEATDD